MSAFGKEPPFTAARNDRARKPRKRVNWIWLVPMAGAAWLIVTMMRSFPL